MQLITYWHGGEDDGELRTLLVDELWQRYNTKDGYMSKYRVGAKFMIEIPEKALISEVWFEGQHIFRKPSAPRWG